MIEITADIFARIDCESGHAVVDLILDKAAQKGTGKWTSQSALDLGTPTPTINAAVESRILSAYKEERLVASEILIGPQQRFSADAEEVISMVRDSFFAAKICSIAQGFSLLRSASEEYE